MNLRDIIRGKRLWTKMAAFLAVLGPGMITASVDNDSGGIAVCTIAGADFGFSLLWTIPFILVALILVQVTCARLGVVTGKGLADLIRETYGMKVTFYVMLCVIAVNFATVVAQFAGVAAALEIFMVPKWLSVSSAGLFVWWLVTKGNYKRVERVFLGACIFYVAYIFSGFLAKPAWKEVALATISPALRFEKQYLIMALALVGGAISPWMQFFQQSLIVDKGTQPEDYKYVRLDVAVGCVVTCVVIFFIIVACAATLYPAKVAVHSASEAALALKPLAGGYCSTLFALGLLNASLFAASILPLCTAYSVCEGMGWQTGLDLRFEEAPQFYTLYTLLVAAGAAFCLWPKFPLIKVMVWSQVLNGLLLPIILFLMINLANRKEILGEHANSRFFSAILWIVAGAISLLSFTTVVSLVVG